jgi:hypothetical protein
VDRRIRRLNRIGWPTAIGEEDLRLVVGSAVHLRQRVLRAYGDPPLIGQFVTTEAIDGVTPDRIASRSTRLTGEGGTKWVLGLVAVDVPSPANLMRTCV